MANIQFVGTATEAERLVNQSAAFKAIALAVNAGLRVAMPGVVASFNAEKQTVEVDVAIYDKIKLNGVVQDRKIPTLLDCPIVIPKGGGFALTFPIQAGDECLIIFADMCINEWFDAGGINNVQQQIRRHDLADGFAILAPSSQPKVLSSYSTSDVQLRTEDGNTFIGINPGNIVLDGLLNLTGVSVPSISSPSISLPVKLNGVTYYLKLSSTP